MKKLLKDYMVVYNDVSKTAYADFTATLSKMYDRIRDVIRAVKVISDALPAVVSSISVPSAAQSVEFKLKSDIAKLIGQVKDIISTTVTHHREVFQKGAINIINTADSKFTDILTFAGFAAVANVPNNAGVQALYRGYTLKRAVMDQLKAIAGAVAGTSAANALAAVTAAIPLPGDVKTKVDAEITIAKTAGPPANPAAVITALTNKLAAAVVDMDKVVLTIAKTYADEDNKLNAPATVPDLVPDPPGFPVGITTVINQVLLEARQKATQAAAAPGATKATVVAALTFAPVDAKEYTLLAAGASVSAAVPAVNYYSSIVNAAATYESVFDQSLAQSFGQYKTYITKAGQELMVLPPGPAVAGVYASVDANRGVWKAPANTSLASVLGPLVLLNAQDQETLNVDANAGKSINAIRAFTGKGTLVWGSRTLAGNDNEWRYVPVRRFFNYAEESIRKASESFVFEPNDINTWIRVKAMIENFLTLEWRRGALAGAKPIDAFYVKIGLGETMTALDILEGRMIVEVGMAVVRPAEFIILRFAHKMQES
ncbi:phage tail sheath family protein [Chitinophaga sp. Mgbs1]|uniref:Phage tail sheath family protein n=1 Tax=Chitinophaga solisilvae TaxID=1233460 RepID=A0A9Q5D1I5_9BACT|nr:phage tail sheath family protein [Chitinophaga solisilvae]